MNQNGLMKYTEDFMKQMKTHNLQKGRKYFLKGTESQQIRILPSPFNVN